MKLLVACVDMVPENTKRQPWFYMNAIAKGLSKLGYDIWILTDTEADWFDDGKNIFIKNFRSFPQGVEARLYDLILKEDFDSVIWSTGLTDFLFKNKINVLKIPVVAVVTSPRYFLKELLSNSKDLVLNTEFAKQFLLGPFISRKRMNNFFAIPNLKAVVFECKETLRRYTRDHLDTSKTFVIPPPIPEHFITALNHVEVENEIFENQKKKILYFGPPISLRGVDILVQAMSIVVKRIDNVMLYVLSRLEHPSLAQNERRLHSLIKKSKLNCSVDVISGVLQPNEIIGHILSSQVVCLPFKMVVSDVPITVLETLATGIPLITTDVAGVSEFAKNANCTVIPPSDPRALAQALIVILGSPRQGLNQTAKESFLNSHSLENFASSFDKILREACQQKYQH